MEEKLTDTLPSALESRTIEERVNVTSQSLSKGPNWIPLKIEIHSQEEFDIYIVRLAFHLMSNFSLQNCGMRFTPTPL